MYDVTRSPNIVNAALKPGNSRFPSGDRVGVGLDETK